MCCSAAPATPRSRCATANCGAPAVPPRDPARSVSRPARPAGQVEAEAWGPGADWLLERLPELLGESDDPAQLTARHRIVHEARRRHPGVRLARTGLVLESLIPSILEQKVTSDEAYRAWRLLLQRHGEPAPDPGRGCG